MSGPAIAAFACYFFMAVAAYLTGKYYYPIPYPVEKMGAYLGGAMLGYAGIIYVPVFLPDLVIYRIMVGGIVFCLYLLFLILLERKGLLVLMKKLRH